MMCINRWVILCLSGKCWSPLVNNIIASIQKCSDWNTVKWCFWNCFRTIKKAEIMSLAVDESTDGSDVASCVSVWDSLMGCAFGRNCWDQFHWTDMQVVSFFTEHRLDLKQVNMLVTHDALSMVGEGQMRSLLCLIHQSFLCAKLSSEF